MKRIVFTVLAGAFLCACNKDKFTSVPQIKFKSIAPNVWRSDNLSLTDGPVLTLQLTDAEGDFGFSDGQDTSYVYVKNLTIPPFDTDSFKFPDLSQAVRKNLDVELNVLITDALAVSNNPNRPYTDTLFFEVYVKDFAKNKSNVIVTPEPVYYLSP